MAIAFYGHPFSSYCQKVLIALYENAIPFDYRVIGPDNPEIVTDWLALWPLAKFPVVTDGDRLVAESSIIIEYLDRHYPGAARLIPDDPFDALDVRFMDRFFDNHVMTPMQQQVIEALKGDDARLAQALVKTSELLDRAYGWLETRLDGGEWAAGSQFTMADCAAGPSLFYADWVHPIGDSFPAVRAYRSRLLERPSFARAVDEARPYRVNFPLGAPDRD